MKKLFTNDTFFSTVVMIAVIGSLLGGAIMFAVCPEVTVNAVTLIISAICILIINISYRNHNKNLLKGMMGAALMGLIVCEIQGLASTSSNFDTPFAIIFVILAVILFINHFIINSTRNPSPINVAINRVIVVLYAITNTVWMAMWIYLAGGSAETIGYVAYILCFPCLMASIVCVESRLDAYRLDREAAGWSEEKGYPEGYVHEYEKNKK